MSQQQQTPQMGSDEGNRMATEYITEATQRDQPSMGGTGGSTGQQQQRPGTGFQQGAEAYQQPGQQQGIEGQSQHGFGQRGTEMQSTGQRQGMGIQQAERSQGTSQQPGQSQGMGIQQSGQSQEMGTPQQQVGTQQPGGQQGIGAGQEIGAQQEAMQQPGPQLTEMEDALTGEMRLALHDFVQAAIVCEWCADRCIDEGPGMEECIRLCRDVADLATLNVQFMARDSAFGQELAETFASAARECADECARHPHSHCQECANTLTRAVDSTWSMLESFERQAMAGGAQQPAPQY